MEKATDLLSSPQSLFSLKSLKLKTKQQELLIRISILCLVYILAFITRLFSVLRYESMIHEFDPYFNYRTTLYLTQKGFYEFWNWFDSESWYPLGRIIGGTLYPGLMVTAAFIYWILRFLRYRFLLIFCILLPKANFNVRTYRCNSLRKMWKRKHCVRITDNYIWTKNYLDKFRKRKIEWWVAERQIILLRMRHREQSLIIIQNYLPLNCKLRVQMAIFAKLAKFWVYYFCLRVYMFREYTELLILFYLYLCNIGMRWV